MIEPRTKAGREFLDTIQSAAFRDEIHDAILAIEAEAAAGSREAAQQWADLCMAKLRAMTECRCGATFE